MDRITISVENCRREEVSGNISPFLFVRVFACGPQSMHCLRGSLQISSQYFSWPVSILFSSKTSRVLLWISLANFAFAGWDWLSTTFLPGRSWSYKGRKCVRSQTSSSWNETKTCLSGNTCYWFKCLFTLTLKTSWNSKKGGVWKGKDSWERSVLHGVRIFNLQKKKRTPITLSNGLLIGQQEVRP